MSHSELKQHNSPADALDPRNIAQRLAQLPPEKKAQFRALLKARNIDSWQLPIVALPHPENRAVLSSAQQRLWFIEQYEQGSALYNLTGRLVLNGYLNQQAMAQAFAMLLQRHHILRSTYQIDEAGQAFQQVESDYELPFDVHLHVADIDQTCEQLANQPFALDRDLPVRIALLSQEGDDSQCWHLLFVIHHIAFDAWSESLLIQELAALYEQCLQGMDEPNGEPVLQYADYATWQREWLASEPADEQRAFWRTTLTGAPVNTQLPFDFPYPDVVARNYQGAQESLTLPVSLLREARAFASREGTTLYNVMQAAFLLLLNQRGAGADICLGTSVANRQRPELEEMLGFLVNTLVLRHKLPQQVTFRKLVAQVSGTTQAAFEHQDLPFDLLLDELNIERGQAWSPLFQVLFVYRNVPRSTLELTDLSVDVVERELKHARFDLTVRLNEIRLNEARSDQGAETLRIDLEYSTELFRGETVRSLLQQYQQTLAQVLGEPDSFWNIHQRETALLSASVETTPAESVLQEAAEDSEAVIQLAEQIAAGYQELLCKPISVQDSFFQQGGDSILCLQLAARLKKSGIRLTPKLVFARQTPIEIARSLLNTVPEDSAAVVQLAEQIAAGYRELLHKNISLEDSFFRNGGDSILCLQLVARLKKSGIRLTPKQVFARQTPIAIARDLLADEATPKAESGSQPSQDTQAIPLAPIQHWFFEQHLMQADHWNQSVLLRYATSIDIASFRQAVAQVFALHPQLSVRYTASQEVSPQAQAVCRQHPATSTWTVEQHTIAYSELETRLGAQQSLFTLHDTAPIRVDVIDISDREGGRILLSAHHLVVDGVSWRVLISQLCQAYFSLSAGIAADLLSPPVTYGQWVQDLQHWPEEKKRAARNYWQPLAGTDTLTQQRWVSLPAVDGTVDFSQPNRLADSDFIDVRLASHLTRKLTTTALESYELGINDLLLAALNGALAQWRGEHQVLIELEGHGRQHDELDLSQTIGWFTSRYPVLLRCHSVTEADSLTGTDTVEWTDDTMRQLVLDTQAQLRRVPDQGQGFGVLKYLCGELTELVTPSIVFNYLGQLDRGLSMQDIALADEQVPEQRHGNNARKQWLDINGMIKNGELVLRWQFNRNVQTTEAIRAVAESFIARLTDLINHCEQAVSGVALGDYPLIAESVVSQAALEHLVASLPVSPTQVDNLYPLTPTQQGMLFHTLAEPQKGLYLNQSLIDFHGELDTDALQQAWQALIDHHPVLRSGFIWEGLDIPLQYVSSNAALDWQKLTLSGGELLEDSLRELADAELQQGFDISHPVLMRLKLIRIREDYHCLIWTRHHLIVDGWCTGQMVAEVRRSYQSLTEGKGISGSLSVGEFADFVAWLSQQDHAASLDYWQQLITSSGAAESARLPRPFKPELSLVSEAEHGLQQYTQSLTAECTAGLKALAAQHQLTLNSLCQAVWALVLGRYTNHETVTMGITSSGRPDALENAQQMMGVFITTIPLVAQMNHGHRSFIELARTLQNQLLDSREHEHVPLVEIQKISGLTEALFDNLLVFENYPGDQHRMADSLRFTVRETIERNNYPLTLVLIPHQQLDIRFATDPTQIESSVATAMLDDFVTLLTQVASSGEMADCAELMRLLATAKQESGPWLWNQTQTDYDVPATLDAYLARQVRLTPDSTALICPAAIVAGYWQQEGDLTLSYRQLDEHVLRLANYLRQSCQCRRGERIGLSMRRSPEMVIAMLACVKLGCAYVPLDPDMPGQRLAMIAQSASPKVILAQSQVGQLLVDHGVGGEATPIIAIEKALAASQAYNGEALDGAEPDQHVQADDILYVLYTSGSTGKPKGVAIPHGGIVNRIAWMQDTFRLQGDDAVLQKTPYGFDVSVWEFFWPLVSGATLVMAEPDAHKDNARLGELVLDYAISTMHFVPAMLHGFLEGLPGQTSSEGLSSETQTFPGLKRLICSGEALPYHVQQSCLQQLPHVALHNLYGPTEASIDVTWWDCRAQNIVSEVPIGYPIANMQTWILDQHLHPVPVGVEGELYLSGIGLAAGYLGQPELTDAAFIPNPWAEAGAEHDAQHARLYRTGDLARYRPDGAIEYLGRADFQVKIRGQRIELGEIEAILATYPDIREAVAQVRRRAEQDTLVGYVVSDQQLPVEPIIAFLQQRLPAYMVPDHIEILASLPLTHNGKVDRKALPEPLWPQCGFIAPQTPTEQQLARLWQELLGLDSVGRHDNFFALGGHSLLLTRLVNRINQQFNLNLRLALLMEMPDLSSLAACIDMNSHTFHAEQEMDDEDERESFEL
ncbi:non-ribosomal peptide synthetase [Vibrio mangrovi]|uniref:Linear gramicidin synthase subunit D n=1 Tax=Vibrio mangrovi TaxID=474394 RepID=A0A1Y6IQK8_9VIBR|nr:non-ribosomal peptide synthetase [Vibrio mangrovi]MDW6003284.1 non-ribosomal peptide synthetase [Vibrio mangrovi]SMR99927.1 Linear gramicidin synthase subunit D [Vibrio mangrovi]